MKSPVRFRALAVLAGILLAQSVAMAEATLTVGDAAPKLQVAQWVQGDPVKEFDSNHVYVVEFWATWCGPCRGSIPHLNELAQKFKDKGVVVIGQDVWEQDDSGVAAFVKKMGDQMTYRVALDDKSQDASGAMAVNWMKAADQHGIPTAFIIDKQGRIAWIGHPMSLKEQVLEDILAGKFDLAAFAKKYEKLQQTQKLQIELEQKLHHAMQDKNWDAADAALAGLEKTVPGGDRNQFTPLHLRILLGRKDYNGAYKLAELMSDAHQGDPAFQNGLAWTLATTKGVDQRGLILAEKIAESANETAKGKLPQILDTLARTQFMNGKTKEAIGTEQKAVDLAPDEMKSFCQNSLMSYEQGRLPEVRE